LHGFRQSQDCVSQACAEVPEVIQTSGSSEQVCIGVMMSRRFAGRVAWRRPGWPPWQAARREL